MVYPPHVTAVRMQKIVQKDGSIETEYVVDTDLSLTGERILDAVLDDAADNEPKPVIVADETAELNQLLKWARDPVRGRGVTRVVIR